MTDQPDTLDRIRSALAEHVADPVARRAILWAITDYGTERANIAIDRMSAAWQASIARHYPQRDSTVESETPG